MEILLILLIIIQIVTSCVLWHYIRKKPKPLGTIYIIENGQMYIELNDENSENEIRNSKYVTFTVNGAQK